MTAWDKIIINGAVIQNGGTPSTIVIHNRADILRRKEVMSEEQANTPARRAYYCLQCAYLFEEQRGEFVKKFTDFMEDYMRAAPSASDLAEEVFELLENERYYDSMRSMRRIIEHESVRLERVKELLAQRESEKREVETQRDSEAFKPSRVFGTDSKTRGGTDEGEEDDFVESSMRKVTAEPIKSESKRRRRGAKKGVFRKDSEK